MQCANPKCDQNLYDLLDGKLRLVELDVPPEERVLRSDGGFPICIVPSRYFWLCANCSKVLTIKKWTVSGLIFETIDRGSSREILVRSMRKRPVKAVTSRIREQGVLSRTA